MTPGICSWMNPRWESFARRDIWDFLRMQHKEGKTILLTTHYIEEAQHLCDDVMLIDGGRIFPGGCAARAVAEIRPYKEPHEGGRAYAVRF